MTPQRILKDVKEVIPEDAVIFTDVGWNKNGVAQEFDITIPGTIHHSSRSCYDGIQMTSAVLGGKVAAPDKIVINLTGDGGSSALIVLSGDGRRAWHCLYLGRNEQLRIRNHRRP